MTRKLKRYEKLGLVKIINGQPMFHGAMFLYIAADAAAEKDDPEASTKGARVVACILDAARKGGYQHSDDLRERLAEGMRGQTTARMSMEAVEAIGGEPAFRKVLDKAGFNPAHHFPAHSGSLQ